MTFRRSLRLRLLLSGVAGAAIAVLLLSLWLGQAFRDSAQRAFDRDLDDELRTLAAMGEVDERGRFQLQAEPEDHHYAQPFSGHYWRIVTGDRQFQSRSLWDGRLDLALPRTPGPPSVVELAGPGGATLRARAQAIDYPGSAEPVVFIVAADRTIIDAEVDDFRWLAGRAVALVSGILIVLLAVQAAYALRPLHRLAETVGQVRRGEAHRVPEQRLPSEVAPLAHHLNELLDHHDRSVRRARTAAQDLAHALKTPLAVLSLEAERPGPRLPAVVSEQVARMRASVERHLGRGVSADMRSRTSVQQVVRSVVELIARVHRERALQFEVLPGPDRVFAGSQEDLEEMIGNLLDNAGKWAHRRIVIGIGGGADRVSVDVADDGPGLPVDDAADVTARGVRLDQQQPGSGLGLAIVRDLAEGYGGGLVVESGVTGLRARLDLPAA